jgi:ABC-type transport system involved in multi-copper enzyme maturation permease subunit
MNMFVSLYLKELRASRNIFLICVAVILGCDIFLVTRTASWGYWNAMAASLIPLVPLIFLGMVQAYLLINDEWKAGTAPFLRSLPISGWGIVSAKMLAAFTVWVALSLITLAFSGIFYACAPWFSYEWLPLNLLPWSRLIAFIVIFVLGISGAVLFGSIIAQMTFLLGRIVNRFNKLISTVASLVLVYVTTKGGDWLAGLLSFLPKITFEAPNTGEGGLTLVKQTLPTAAVFVFVLELVLLFLAAGWIMGKKAES